MRGSKKVSSCRPIIATNTAMASMAKSPIAAASGIRRAEWDGCVPAILRTALSSNVMWLFPPNVWDAPPRDPARIVPFRCGIRKERR